MDDYEITVTEHELLDTGIGISQGYASDAEFRAAMKAEREALPPEVREAVDEIERDVMRRMMGT